MNLPITEALERHIDDISFHTPAHNGGILNNALAAAKYDITELDFSDNLLSPEGIIAASEAEVARVYGSDRAVYSTAGATALIRTAIYARGNSGTYLVYGNAHKSVYNALRRIGAKAFAYSGKDIKNALLSCNASTLVITTPDYYGNTLDLAEIKSVTDELDVKTIVDASHGGHFAFCSKLPNSATEYFDTVIHSLHKTLPVLTGGAIMHLDEESYDCTMRAFREVHTTSPSYPVMASIERAVDLMERDGERLYSQTLDRIAEFLHAIEGLPLEAARNDDPTRLVLKAVNADASVIARKLEAVGIYPECGDYEKITFIVTPFNADKLLNVARHLQGFTYDKFAYTPCEYDRGEELTELTFGMDIEVVPLSRLIGRVLYEGIGIYPPGSPIALPGEKPSADKIKLIQELRQRGDLSLFGLEKGMAVVLK